jgi:NADPH:quinone reductase-like Zn-dependent oxidoreductase
MKAIVLNAYGSSDVVELKELLEAGKITPVIDKTYPLREAVEAFRYMDQGHARGKVVVSM